MKAKHAKRIRAESSAGTVKNQLQTTYRSAETENALIHCGIKIREVHFLKPESASADMECLAACLQGHPDLKGLRRALLQLCRGIDEIERLAELISEDTSSAAFQQLNAGERWVGAYFQTLIGQDNTFEGLMSLTEGLGEIISKHEQTASLGRMLSEMERSFAVLHEIEYKPKKEAQAPGVRPVGNMERPPERRAA